MNTLNALPDTPSTFAALSAPLHARHGLHELRFASLFDPGRGVSVPCDAAGCVDLGSLPERLRAAYLSVRERVGRDYAFPVVQTVH